MKKIRKALIALGLSIVMTGVTVGTYAPTMVEAATTTYYNRTEYEVHTSGNWSYIVMDKEAKIVQYAGEEGAVSIPTELDGMKVTAILTTYSRHNDRQAGAFKGNVGMQTLVIPSGITYIDTYAFEGCVGLQQVLFSDTVEEIAEGAFYNCQYLQTISFKGAGLKKIGNFAFSKCAALDNVKFPDSLESIGVCAFHDCDALVSIVIPDSVTELGAAAFWNCDSLLDVTIGNGVKELNYYDNWRYSSANSNSEWHGVFESCVALTNVTIGTGVEKIGIDAFAGAGLVSVDIPDNVRTIEQGAFYECNNLVTMTGGNGLQSIGVNAFYSCDKLESVNIGKKVKSIGDTAFIYNVALKEIVIPNSVTSLGAGAFYNCTSLTRAEIGNGVTELKDYDNWRISSGNSDGEHHGTFENCVSLAAVTIGNGVTTIGVDVFAGTALVEVDIPDNVKTVGQGAFQNCQSLKRAVIGDGVTTIGTQAFYGNAVLREVKLGNNVTNIGDRCFWNDTALEELVIPGSVTTVGNALCYGCTSLKKVIIGNGVTELKDYDNWRLNSGNGDKEHHGAFENCTSLEDVAIGNGLTTLGVDAFAGTKITSLLLPAKVSSVGQGSFYNLALTNLYFTGNAPTLGTNLFGASSVPTMNKLAGKTGYDALEYVFTEFTPIKVTYDLNNTEVFAITPATQMMSPKGGYVIEPISPVAEGYTFLGWYQDKACAQKWDFMNDRVTENTTIYAKWGKNDEIVPKVPGDLATSDASATAAKVTWATVDGATGYNVYVDGKLYNSAPIEVCECVINNLTEDTAYEITITAMNEKGESEKSLIKVVQTTEEKIPESPTSLELADKTADSITIQWESVLGATGYRVYVNGELVTETPVKEAGYVISNLEADTTYRVAVSAVNGKGESEKSLEKEFTTNIDRAKGDVNADTFVDTLDAIEVLKYAAGMSCSVDEENMTIADVNKDTFVDTLDAIEILKYAAGMDSVLD